MEGGKEREREIEREGEGGRRGKKGETGKEKRGCDVNLECKQITALLLPVQTKV